MSYLYLFLPFHGCYHCSSSSNHSWFFSLPPWIPAACAALSLLQRFLFGVSARSLSPALLGARGTLPRGQATAVTVPLCSVLATKWHRMAQLWSRPAPAPVTFCSGGNLDQQHTKLGVLRVNVPGKLLSWTPKRSLSKVLLLPFGGASCLWGSFLTLVGK